MTMLPSKHAGTRTDHRHRDRAALHTQNGEAVADETPQAWDRDIEAATRLRDYCSAQEEEK
jgi:hypothetical protein